MEKFPNLKPNQTALVRADISTGHILDEEYKTIFDDTQIAYTVFDSLEDALAYSDKVLEERIGVEIIIYDFNQKLISYKNNPESGVNGK